MANSFIRESGRQGMQAAQFIHGNRLELLADRLIDDLASAGNDDPLRPHVVVVAHPALGRWLQERIAARCGIAANVEFPLPSTFAWEVLREVSERLPRESAFSREALSWRIYAALPACAQRAEFGPVRHYLGAAGEPRQRHQLAATLAQTFDEYTMARPNWIRAWQRARLVLDDTDERWQADLWRALAAGVDEADRASLMQEVLRSLLDGAPVPARLERGLSIFGAAHLPPLLLEFFLGLAQRVPLRFYQPNPCLDYWGEIVSAREQVRQRRLWNHHGRREDEAHLESGHPLLASWGGIGREYLKAIHAPELVVHDDDAFAAPPSTGLLGWLQTGILLLDPDHAPPPPVDTVPSLQVHGCPSRRREVEVLRDALLRLFETLDDLKPHDIVVMSPRIEEYVPFVAAVFGDRDDPLAIPYRISDVALRATHPLIDAFARILALGESRFAVSEILGFLAEPAIARRFELDGEAQDWLRTWIADSGIRWGLDADFRAALGAAAIEETTWRFGFNRLLLGHALGDDAVMLADVVPASNVEGSPAQWLGEFARFVDALARTRTGLATPRSAGNWKRWLIERLEALFDGEGGDPLETAAIGDLREAIAALGNEASRWLGDETLDFAVVRSALDAQIAAPRASRGGRFGITFCGMVPMRNVPHRVVCVLGLDAGEFPRRQAPAGFNLMRRYPRAGDRSIREDDRFLFLESLIAARDVFILSHVDRDARTGAANPPSPLVEELTGFLAAAYGAQAWPEARAAILRRHPMHPFAAECFRAGSPSPSYDQRWWSAARLQGGGWIEPAPFVPAGGLPATLQDLQAIEIAPANEWTDLDIDVLLAWLAHPVRAYFRQQLPLDMVEAERDEDIEAFTLDRLGRYQLADRLLGPTPSRPNLHRVQREGRFPLGTVGAQSWEELVEQVAALELKAQHLLGGPFDADVAEARSIGFDDLRVRLTGMVRHRVSTADGHPALLLARPGRIRGIDLARLALERALLGSTETNLPAFAIGFAKGQLEAFRLGSLGQPGTWVRDLLAWRDRGLRQALPAFRRSAEAFAATFQRRGDEDQARRAAHAIWSEGDFPESADPHHRLFARHRDESILGEVFEAFARELFVPLYGVVEEVRS
ncbi:exodeoxyribonuclease V subunit gamma [Dokdonella immobilis]|uniref:RecBCD enzyme subunit RecC n=1 Tax=Dokdonella immobilis TaxID=578942 RepID=A0A1I5AGJ6_9GAMM|nr:exodeoxyribonuclease V subunit gamma [Dokdonella immobilis]SFN61500.1 DNA helicase/exodeoxyribonuclease V, gamma subunit [Dokdonella immobilis]